MGYSLEKILSDKNHNFYRSKIINIQKEGVIRTSKKLYIQPHLQELISYYIMKLLRILYLIKLIAQQFS